MSEEYRYSTLTLYKNCEIIPEKNFFVEDIETYLSGLTKESVSEFQYLRNTLTMDIKIHKQEVFTELIANNNFNYLKVVQNSRTYYYFIINKTQTAEETITLSLLMDTINTIRWDSDFTAGDRTKVLREHKDRFYKTQGERYVLDNELSGDLNFGNNESQDFSMNLFITNSDKDKIENYLNEVYISNMVLTNSESEILDPSDYSASILSPSLSQVGEDWIFSFTLRLTIPEVDLRNQLYSYGIEFSCLIPTLIRRKIDLYSEGLNPVLYKAERGNLEDFDKAHWYLMYKTNAQATEDDPKPVNCYLIPNASISVKAVLENQIIPSSLDSGKWYIFTRTIGQNPITISWTGFSATTNYWRASSENQYYGFAIRIDPNDATRLEVKVIVWRYDAIFQLWNDYTTVSTNYTGSIKITSFDSPIKCVEADSFNKYGDYYYTPANWNFSITRTESTIQLKGLNEVDRTESLLLKIFALPYNPANFEIDSDGDILFSDEWEFDSDTGLMKLKDLNTKFDREIESGVYSPFKEVFSDLDPQADEIPLNLDRYFIDPKLYHSDYYQPKFVYDSFGFVFALERMNQYAEYPEWFKFNFAMTTTIRSRFMFKFEDYNLQYKTEDYDNILSIARNNEVVIYNSAYLTYLRTGYNIDVKAKERTERTAILGGILQGVGSISQLASTDKASGVVSAITSLGSTIINTINTIAQSEESMERRLATLKAQAVGVEGSDDIDLLGYYSNNRAKYAIYKVSERLEKELDNLFYYTGYISNEMKIPNTQGRYWFNFVSAEIVFSNLMGNISDICLQEIKNLWKEGVVFLHEHSGNYDFEQVKENWEIFLVNL